MHISQGGRQEMRYTTQVKKLLEDISGTTDFTAVENV
jgi:hypothetical protein